MTDFKAYKNQPAKWIELKRITIVQQMLLMTCKLKEPKVTVLEDFYIP